MSEAVQTEELVSVVIPTYKRGMELKRALSSILCQTHTNLEIIIIDDNIEDEFSKKVLEIVSKCNDNRVKYIKNTNNLGGALSRNRGIEIAKGEYIAFLDDDDCYVPQNVELKLNKFNNSKYKNVALVYGWAQSRNVDGDILVNYENTVSGSCLYEAMLDCQAATSQWMCRREALIDVGMFSNVPSKQDSTLMIKLLLKNYEIDYVPQVLSYYYEHSNNRISMGNIKNIQGEQLLRDFIRNNYGMLRDTQRKEIEESSGLRILRLSIKNRQYDVEKEEVKQLMGNCEHKCRIIFLYIKWILRYKILKLK